MIPNASSGPDPGWRRGAHLLALWGLVSLQPTLLLVGGSITDFVIVREVGGPELIVVVLTYALLPPALLLGLEQLVPRRWRAAAHLLLVAGLVAVGGLYALRQVFPGGGLARAALLVLGALAISGVLTRLYRDREFLPRLLTALSPAPLTFVAIFLVSPANAVVFPGERSQPSTPPIDGAPVVIVVLDELPTSTLLDRRGRIDARLFPTIAGLADRGTWYRNAVAAADATQQALPALTTGRRAPPGTVPVASQHPESIFTLFGDSSRVVASEWATRICDVSICPPRRSAANRVLELLSTVNLANLHAVSPRVVQERLPDLGRSWGRASEDPEDPPDPDRVSPLELSAFPREQFEAFIDRIERLPRDDEARLVYLHATLPHAPWMYYRSGRQYAPHHDETPGLRQAGDQVLEWLPAPGLVSRAFARHVLQAQATDALLGRLLDALRERGLYDRSVIALVADHGASFVPGGAFRALREGNQADVAMVPTIIKAPGQREGEIDDRLVRAIDVLPTIAELSGLDLPWQPDGRSLRDERGRSSDRARFVDATEGRQVSLRLDELLEGRAETVARNRRMLGAPLRPLRPSPGRRLLGGSLQRLRLEGPSVSVDDAGRHREVDPDARFVPGLVEGTVADADPEDHVAVAVDDRIRAVAPIYASGGQHRFAALLPQAVVRRPSLELEVGVVALGAGGDR